MAKMLEFPTKAVRDWRQIESGIAEVLRTANVSDAMKAQVTTHMREHFDELNRSANIPMTLTWPTSISPRDREAIVSAVQGAVDKLVAEMQAQTNVALAQLLQTEMLLYVAQHGDV